MLSTEGTHFPIDVMLLCINWCVTYPLSYHCLEEMTEIRSMSVDHSSVNRWALRFLPVLEKACPRCKRPAGASWCMDETYTKVVGRWKCPYQAVDGDG